MGDDVLRDHAFVLIGASGAIGSSFLERAVELGARCVTVGRRDPGRGKGHLQADLMDIDAMHAAACEAQQQLGRIDTVIDFVGTHHAPMDFVADDPAELLQAFRHVVDINLTGAFIVTAVFGRLMVVQRHGHIIHLCSNGSRASLYGSYAYVASKHGVEGLVKTAAAQLAPFGVRVNGVAPGTVETALNRGLLRNASDGALSARAASILAHTPTKRFATLEGVSETLLAMCLPQRHLTGNVVFCDDGYNIEGHSWPDGNRAVYDGPEALERLLSRLSHNDDV